MIAQVLTRIATAAWLAAVGLIALAAVAMMSPAQAQIFTVPIPECVDAADALPVPAPVKPIGLPEPLRASAPASVLACKTLIGTNAVGAFAAVACPEGGAIRPYLYAIEWAAVTPAMLADFAQLALPGDSRQRIFDMTKTYQTKSIWRMCDVWGHKRAEINVLFTTAPPSAPPAGSWIVAKNGVYPDRPTYISVNGVRQPKSNGRVNVGAPCDCNGSKLVEGKTTYCATEEYAQGTATVAVCTEVKP